MKIYIAVDMEGISGISTPDYVKLDGRMYPVGQRLMTADASAAVRGAFDGGADQVIVADFHGSGLNILPELLDERAMLLAGTPHQPRFPFLDKTVDGLILLGYHAMAGTTSANLEHTMSSASWHRFTVNGRAYGELGIDAELAAEAGVPVIMASGDDKLCEEAAAWLPGVQTAMVKQGLSRQSALCLSPAAGQKKVYEAARQAVERLAAGEQFFLPPVSSPACVELTYKMVPDADAANVYGTRRIDGYTVQTVYNRLSDRFGGLWAEKETPFKL